MESYSTERAVAKTRTEAGYCKNTKRVYAAVPGRRRAVKKAYRRAVRRHEAAVCRFVADED
jgi:hypothetical protein